MTTKEEYKKLTAEFHDLRKQEQTLVIENMPKFERGVAEAALERERLIWKDLKEVFKKHNIVPSMNFTIVSDTQPSEDANRPTLVCGGVKTSLEYLVPPMDSAGRDGRMPDDVIDKIVELRAKRAEVEKKLKITN